MQPQSFSSLTKCRGCVAFFKMSLLSLHYKFPKARNKMFSSLNQALQLYSASEQIVICLNGLATGQPTKNTNIKDKTDHKYSVSYNQVCHTVRAGTSFNNYMAAKLLLFITKMIIIKNHTEVKWMFLCNYVIQYVLFISQLTSANGTVFSREEMKTADQ